MSFLGLGILALVVFVAGLVTVLLLARRQRDSDEAPESQPSDYVAPVSSGGYRWRKTDESLEDFHARVAKENADAAKKA